MSLLDQIQAMGAERTCVATKNAYGFPLAFPCAELSSGIAENAATLHDDPPKSCEAEPAICTHHLAVYAAPQAQPVADADAPTVEDRGGCVNCCCEGFLPCDNDQCVCRPAQPVADERAKAHEALKWYASADYGLDCRVTTYVRSKAEEALKGIE